MSKKAFLETLREIDARYDNNLHRYYVPTKSLRALSNMANPCLLAIGLKGIGKTVAYAYLTHWEKVSNVRLGIFTKNFRLDLPKSSISHVAFADQLKSNIVHLLLQEILIQSKQKTLPVRNDLLQDAAVLTGKFREIFTDVFERLKQFGGLSILGCGFQLNKKGEVEIAQLVPNKQENKAEKVLSGIADCGVKLRLVFDDPDRVFSTENVTNPGLVAGLCLAGRQLSKLSSNIKINILLKTHVYTDIMKIEEMRNMPYRFATHLAWTESELQKLIARRLSYSECAIEDIFPPDKDEQDKVFQHLFMHSRNGPRDVVRWLEVCLEHDLNRTIDVKRLRRYEKEYAELSCSQMTVIYESQYEAIVDFLQHYFGRYPYFQNKDEFEQNFVNFQVTAKEESRFLFEKNWIKTADRALSALTDTASIAYRDKSTLILPYMARYHEPQEVRDLPFSIVPAFKPLIQTK